MEQRSGIPGRGWGGIAESPYKRLLGGGVRYDEALRISGRRRFLPRPRPHPRPRCVHPPPPPPPPPPPYVVVVVVIVIEIVVPSAHLPSSLSPPPEFALPDATWLQGTARRYGTGSGLARRGGDDSLLR